MEESTIFFHFKDPMVTAIHVRNESAGPFKMHTHSFAELYCILSGNGIFHVEGSHYDLRPGDMMLIRPSEAHYIEVDPAVPYERICVNFNINLFAHLDPENKLMRPYFDRANGVYNHYDSVPENLQLIKNIVKKGGNLATITANLMLLLSNLQEEFGRKPQQDNKNSIEYQIISYINRHLDRDLSIEELCRMYFLSRSQLCRRFQKATGTSIGKYVAAKRMIQAHQLIQQGQKPTEVYSACGYGDYTTFYRAYKAYFGTSPKQKAEPDQESTDTV